MANGERRAWFGRMGFTVKDVVMIVTIALGLAGTWYGQQIAAAKRESEVDDRVRLIAAEVVEQKLAPINVQLADVNRQLAEIKDNGNRFDTKLDRMLEAVVKRNSDRRVGAAATTPPDRSWQ